jgi:protein arginine N-methyltransferase 1/protein arginine N-methyltransferase 6
VCGTIELEPGYNPGERRSLNIYFNYDVVSGGKEEKTLVEPDDREWFQRWTVQ